MNTKELAAVVAEKANFKENEVHELLKIATEVIKDTVSKRRPVSMSDFGTFMPKDRASRTGRNPKTGEFVNIPETTVVTFKPSQKFKDMMSCKREV